MKKEHKKMKTKYFGIIFLLVGIFLAIIMMGTVSSADVTINDTSTGGLRTAINGVGIGETIYMENGLYAGTNNRNLTISKNLTIEGKGGNVTINAQGNGRIFNITSDITVILKNLNIINGKVSATNVMGGAIYIDNANVKMVDCNFINNSVTPTSSLYSPSYGYGGAIYTNNGSLTINNCNFTNNSVAATSSNYFAFARGYGGVIYHNSSIGNLAVNDCNFFNNTITVVSQASGGYGGAIYNTGSAGYIINLNMRTPI